MAAAAPAAAAASAVAPAALSPSVYVGDLAPEVTEAMLWEHFRKIGQVLSVRVCIDFQTKKSLGYGYVNFSKPPEATAAIEQLNGSIILNRACRVDRIQRDPTVRKSGICNIVIKGLPDSTDQDTVRNLFSKYGRITSMHMPRDEKTGKLRGYAYVNFDKEENAINAVKDANGQLLSDGETTIAVERYKNMAPIREAERQRFTNTFIRNFREDIDTDDKLRAALQQFGNVTAIQVRVAPPDARIRGNRACVAFETHESALALLDKLNGDEGELAHPGLKLAVSRFMTKKERARESEKKKREKQILNSQYPNLYVKHFDDTITDEMLRQVFSRFGEVMSARVMKDENGVSREFGFVSFRDRAAADAAINSMGGSTELGHRPLYIAHCVSKDARRAQIEEQTRKRVRGGPMGMMPGAANMPGGFPGGMMGGGGPAGMMGGPMGMPGGMPGYGGNMGGGMRGPMGMPGGFPGGMMGGGGPAGMMGGPMMGPGGMMGGPAGMMGGPAGMMPRPLQQPGGMPGGMPGAMPGPTGVPQPRMPVARPPAPAQAQRGGPMGQQLDSQYLSTLAPEQQKNLLGERLYEHISRVYPQHASKVTGMLLEMDNAEILNLLDSTSQLDSKVREALDVLQRHNQS